MSTDSRCSGTRSACSRPGRTCGTIATGTRCRRLTHWFWDWTTEPGSQQRRWTFLSRCSGLLKYVTRQANPKDIIEQIWGNVLTNATKHKETTVHKRFWLRLSSSGVRRETDNKKRRKRRRGHTHTHTHTHHTHTDTHARTHAHTHTHTHTHSLSLSLSLSTPRYPQCTSAPSCLSSVLLPSSFQWTVSESSQCWRRTVNESRKRPITLYSTPLSSGTLWLTDQEFQLGAAQFRSRENSDIVRNMFRAK